MIIVSGIMEESTDTQNIMPSQMSYSFGKPLTEEEFLKLKANNPSVRTISCPIEIPARGSRDEMQEKLRQKIRESQVQRSPAPPKKSS